MGPIGKVVRTLLLRLQPLVNAQNTFARWYLYIIIIIICTCLRACVSTVLCDGVRATLEATAEHHRIHIPGDRFRVQGVFAGFDDIII